MDAPEDVADGPHRPWAASEVRQQVISVQPLHDCPRAAVDRKPPIYGGDRRARPLRGGQSCYFSLDGRATPGVSCKAQYPTVSDVEDLGLASATDAT